MRHTYVFVGYYPEQILPNFCRCNVNFQVTDAEYASPLHLGCPFLLLGMRRSDEVVIADADFFSDSLQLSCSAKTESDLPSAFFVKLARGLRPRTPSILSPPSPADKDNTTTCSNVSFAGGIGLQRYLAIRLFQRQGRWNICSESILSHSQQSRHVMAAL